MARLDYCILYIELKPRTENQEDETQVSNVPTGTSPFLFIVHLHQKKDVYCFLEKNFPFFFLFIRTVYLVLVFVICYEVFFFF